MNPHLPVCESGFTHAQGGPGLVVTMGRVRACSDPRFDDGGRDLMSETVLLVAAGRGEPVLLPSGGGEDPHEQ